MKAISAVLGPRDGEAVRVATQDRVCPKCDRQILHEDILIHVNASHQAPFAIMAEILGTIASQEAPASRMADSIDWDQIDQDAKSLLEALNLQNGEAGLANSSPGKRRQCEAGDSRVSLSYTEENGQTKPRQRASSAVRQWFLAAAQALRATEARQIRDAYSVGKGGLCAMGVLIDRRLWGENHDIAGTPGALVGTFACPKCSEK